MVKEVGRLHVMVYFRPWAKKTEIWHVTDLVHVIPRCTEWEKIYRGGLGNLIAPNIPCLWT